MSTRGPVGRMCYLNFAERITGRHGIILENWPLGRFCAPGEISSRPELETLIGAWTTNATRFRALTDAEWDAWKLKQSGGGGEPEGGCRGDDETPIFFRIFPYFLRPFVRHLDLEPVVRSM